MLSPSSPTPPPHPFYTPYRGCLGGNPVQLEKVLLVCTLREALETARRLWDMVGICGRTCRTGTTGEIVGFEIAGDANGDVGVFCGCTPPLALLPVSPTIPPPSLRGSTLSGFGFGLTTSSGFADDTLEVVFASVSFVSFLSSTSCCCCCCTPAGGGRFESSSLTSECWFISFYKTSHSYIPNHLQYNVTVNTKRTNR